MISTRILVALLLVAGAACGARLDDKQLLAARRQAMGTATSGDAIAAGSSEATAGTAALSGDSAAGATAASRGSPSAGAATSGSSASGGGAAPAAGAGNAVPAAGGAATTGGAPACAADVSSTDPGVSAKEIHFGNVSTTGGPVPGIFKGARDGTNAFFAYINSGGGVCGRLLRLDYLDDNLDASQNQNDYANLVEKTLGFVGGFSPVDSGAVQVLKQHPDVPDVGFTATKERLALANNFSPQPLRFPGFRLGPMQYEKTLFGDAVIKKMAFFTEDVQPARDATAGQMAAAHKLGYDFVYSRITEPTDADFTADVTNMKNRGVKGIFMFGDVGQIARIAAAMRAQNFSVPLAAWSSNAYDPQFLAGSQGGAEGALLDVQEALFLGEDAATVPEVRLFNEWLRKVGGKPDLYAVYAWSSARLAVQALQRAGGKPTRAAMLAALKSIHQFDANGLLAPTDPAGKVPPTCWVLVRVKNGKFVRDVATPAGFRCDPGGYFG